MNKNYPTLYARATTGKILEWQVEQLDAQYRVISGQHDGKKVVSEWTTARGKNQGRSNETTDVEQADAEISAMYVKKKKQKYKESPNDVDIQTYFKPMLAKNYNDYKDKIINFNVWCAQLKLNGSRCIATKDGLFTRTGEKYLSVPHILEDLKPVFEKNPDIVLDGELFNDEYRQQLNELMKLVRKTVNITPEDLVKSEQIVQYHVYDLYDPNNPDFPYDTRKSEAMKMCFEAKTKYVKNVDTYYLSLNCPDYMNQVYQAALNGGHEGIMLRHRYAPYENKRSKNLLKLKPEMDDECVILNVLEGEGNWSAKCKTFTVEWNGKVFDASLKGSMEDATNIWNNKEQWIGRRVKFLYNDLTGLKIPNFARIDCNNCEPST
jgi:DNA ligase-1